MDLRCLSQVIGLIALNCFMGCASIERAPRVAVKPNNSGIKIGTIHQGSSRFRLGENPRTFSAPFPPEVPSLVAIEVKRFESLHNKEPRFFISASGLVQIVSVEPFSFYRESRERLWNLLESPGVPRRLGRPYLIPEFPHVNGGNCFYGKLRKRSFPWGDAFLYLTTYVNGITGGPYNNDMLVLVAQGLTRDGRYAVNARLAIRHPKLPDSLWDERLKGKAVFLIDEDWKDPKAEQWLDSQPNDSFTPTFGQYETFLSSLEIRPQPLIVARGGKN